MFNGSEAGRGGGLTASILILTDRLGDGLSLRRGLEGWRPCQVVGLHDDLPSPASVSLLVCDVAFDDLPRIKLLQTALDELRRAAVPVICLLRDPSHLSMAYARSIGATAVLPRNTPADDVLKVAQTLVSAGQGGPKSATGIETDVQEAEQALHCVLEAAAHQKPISKSALDQGGSAVLTAVKRAGLRPWLDIVWKHDDATYQHSLLVAGLAATFAGQIGLTTKHQNLMAQAGLIHDIGKARIPLAILKKPGRLSAEEMRVMQTHAALGYSMLVSEGGFEPQLLDIVRHHHEYLDGSGYPDGLRGEQISNFVRVTTVCDIYAALVERRPYRTPMRSQDAFAKLASARGKLDPAVVQAFAKVAKAA